MKTQGCAQMVSDTAEQNNCTIDGRGSRVRSAISVSGGCDGDRGAPAVNLSGARGRYGSVLENGSAACE